MNDNLLVEDDGAVRVVTIHRPTVLNALNRATLSELQRAIVDAEGTPRVRVLVITGAGERSFVAGADLTELSTLTPDDARAYSAEGHRLMDALSSTRFPAIAAVNGFALGGGLELALACDFICCSDNARLGLVEANLGLLPGFGGVARLSRRVGRAMAAEMILSAAHVKADEALRIGLVNRVWPQASLLSEVKNLARAMADKAPLAVAAVKRLLREGEDADLRVANALEQSAFGLLFSTEDKRVGVDAFLNKAKAAFVGR